MRRKRSLQQIKDEGELPLGDNEFVCNELVLYFNRAYGNKLGQNKFSHNDIAAWVYLGKIPEIYGGYTVTAVMMSGISVYTVNGLSREDLRYVRQSEQFTPKELLPRWRRKPLRTKLYYKLANKKIPKDVLPDNWKELGIKANQLKVYKKKKKQVTLKSKQN